MQMERRSFAATPARFTVCRNRGRDFGARVERTIFCLPLENAKIADRLVEREGFEPREPLGHLISSQVVKPTAVAWRLV